MIDRIKGPGATQSTSKSKKTSKTGQTSSVSFADLVNQASAVEQAAPTAPTTAVDAVLPKDEGSTGGGYIPTEPKARGHYILDRLSELEQDILSGSPTAALNSLKEALATEAAGKDELPPRLQKLLDEVELRAEIELAKIETEETN